MRKIFALSVALAIVLCSFGSTSILLPAKSSPDITITHNNVNYSLSLLALSHMSVKDYEKMTGKHMKLGDKIVFKIAQRRLRNSLDAYGNPDTKKIKNLLSKTHKFYDGDSHHWLVLTLLTLALAVGLSIIGIFVPFIWVLAAIAGLACAVFFILWLVSVAD